MRRRAAKGGEGEEMHTEKFTHRNVSVLMHAHTLSNPTHLPAVHRRGARCKRKTSARITSCLCVCVSVCLDARAMFMSGDTRKTSIKVREAGVCPSDR